MEVLHLTQEQLIAYRRIVPGNMSVQPLFVRDENNWLYCILGGRVYLWTTKHKWSEAW